MNQLFRQEVLEQKKYNHFGSVFLNRPTYYIFFAYGFALLMSLMLGFIFFVNFFEKTVALGVLNAKKGLIRLFPKKNGVIAKVYIREGDFVRQGDPLYLIDTTWEGQILRDKVLAKFRS